jgi:hypothetical protein
MMADEKKHIYQSSTLGLPPLRMVLVHARNEAQNAGAHAAESPLQALAPEEESTPLDKERAVRKIIEHLETIDR